jgi:hypothetical protein
LIHHERCLEKLADYICGIPSSSQMFGVQPPQTLYHTRPRPKDRVHSTERPSQSHSEREVVLPVNRNVVPGSYLNTDGKQSRHRASSHSHSESMPLLDPPVVGSSSGKRASAVYMHYRYSLNSLGDIIDRVSYNNKFIPVRVAYSLTFRYRMTGNPWLSFIQS